MKKVQHVVLLKFKPAETAATVAKCFSALEELTRLIPGLERFSGGENTSSEGLTKGFTHAFVMTFTNSQARDTYLPHAEHERVKQLVLPHVEDVIVVDYEM